MGHNEGQLLKFLDLIGYDSRAIQLWTYAIPQQEGKITPEDIWKSSIEIKTMVSVSRLLTGKRYLPATSESIVQSEINGITPHKEEKCLGNCLFLCKKDIELDHFFTRTRKSISGIFNT